MSDWIAANWVWLLLGLGALWLFVGGRLGCGGMRKKGTGCRGGHAGPEARPGSAPQTSDEHAGHDRARDVEVSGAPGRRHRGC